MSTRRRQRAAYELALCILRTDVHELVGGSGGLREALGVLRHAERYDVEHSMLGESCWDALASEAARRVESRSQLERRYVARLALYLRAWLRADVGDCGPAIEWLDGGWSVVSSRRITPLWEQAGGAR